MEVRLSRLREKALFVTCAAWSLIELQYTSKIVFQSSNVIRSVLLGAIGHRGRGRCVARLRRVIMARRIGIGYRVGPRRVRSVKQIPLQSFGLIICRRIGWLLRRLLDRRGAGRV